MDGPGQPTRTAFLAADVDIISLNRETLAKPVLPDVGVFGVFDLTPAVADETVRQYRLPRQMASHTVLAVLRSIARNYMAWPFVLQVIPERCAQDYETRWMFERNVLSTTR